MQQFCFTTRPWVTKLAAFLTAVSLVACGGGKSGASSQVVAAVEADPLDLANSVVYNYPDKPLTDQEAHRFLTQATFGPTPTEIARVKAMGYRAWLEEQLAQPASTTYLQLNTARNAASGGKHQFTHAFWEKALAGPDQLRQRMAFALSQIFVVSFADACATSQGAGIASYYDLLAGGGLGRYRDLLEAVALHPIMGCYLSHLRNQKEDPATGRVPDENFAREVMQLFSIGLVELNMNGTPRLDAQGKSIETYGPADIGGLAKVFTGYSWDCPQFPADVCFRYWGGAPRPGEADPWATPMRAYPQFHSASEKRFLGTVIPAQTPAAPSLKIALDTLSNHANVAPFLGRQLIQRFVTSNPSPAYVLRVANVFKASGGSFGTTLKAILLDPEARSVSSQGGPNFGKVREPVLRLSATLRALGATSDTGAFLIGETRQAATGLNQSPLFAPSVFNFYRPGYVPPASQTALAGLVAPELQLAEESSMAGYTEFMKNAIWAGLGPRGYNGLSSRADVQMSFNTSDTDPLLLQAANPDTLVTTLDQRLTNGTLLASTRKDITDAVRSIDFRAAVNPTPDQVRFTYTYRVWSAVLLFVASNEFLVQK